jgi:hypothetical protein
MSGFIYDSINPEPAEMMGGYRWAQLILKMFTAPLSPHKMAHFLLLITGHSPRDAKVTFRVRGHQDCKFCGL